MPPLVADQRKRQARQGELVAGEPEDRADQGVMKGPAQAGAEKEPPHTLRVALEARGRRQQGPEPGAGRGTAVPGRQGQAGGDEGCRGEEGTNPGSAALRPDRMRRDQVLQEGDGAHGRAGERTEMQVV